MDGDDLTRMLLQAQEDRRWSRRDLADQLRAAAGRRTDSPLLPSTEHLVRSIRRHESGETRPYGLRRALLCDVFG